MAEWLSDLGPLAPLAIVGLVAIAILIRRGHRPPDRGAAADLLWLEAFMRSHAGWCLSIEIGRVDGCYAEVLCPRSQMPEAAADWYVVANAREYRLEWIWPALRGLLEGL